MKNKKNLTLILPSATHWGINSAAGKPITMGKEA
jgi:hypothetical protein